MTNRTQVHEHSPSTLFPANRAEAIETLWNIVEHEVGVYYNLFSAVEMLGLWEPRYTSQQVDRFTYAYLILCSIGEAP